MKRTWIATAAALACLASNAQAFVSFDEARYMFPDSATNSVRQDGEPSLANDGNGNWVVATVGPYISRSSDNGDTWTVPAALPGGDGYPPGALYTDPMVATDKNGTWIVVENFIHAMPDQDKILVWRSIDNGANWSGPVDLAAAAGTSSDVRPRIATDGAGKWMVVWGGVEPVHGDVDVLFSTSSDNGSNWSPAAYVNTDALTDSVDDYYPSVATDGAGNWVVVNSWFGDVFNTATWVVRAWRSSNFGASWAGPAEVGPHLGLSWPDIVAAGPGVFVSMHVKVGVIVGRTTDGGASWTNKTISGGYGPFNGRPSHLDTDGNGEWVAIWESSQNVSGETGTDFDVIYSRSTDNGVNWSQPEVLDRLDAIADSNEDAMSAIASDGSSRWIAAWQRNDGGNYDVMMSISDPLCPLVRRNDCITGESGKSSFSSANSSDNTKDKMKLKVSKAGLTDVADFGDPTASGEHLLCLWDSSGGNDRLLWRAVLPAGGTCGGAPCWKPGNGSFSYSDKENEHSAFTKAKLKAGEAGKASVQVQLAGDRIEPAPVPYSQGPSVAVQLISQESGKCWGASFSAPKSNGDGKYSAKSD